EKPLVVQPVERPGQYGGSWRTALMGGDDTAWMDRLQDYEGLVRYNREWTEIVPDVAESYDVNPEGTEFIFYLRRGMKWSDGEPFTADDILFWYDDYFMNEELTPAKHPLLLSGGEPPVVEKVDDHTVVFRYAVPHGLLLEFLAGGSGVDVVNKPRHYLEQFHKTYVPDEIDRIVAEAGFDDWVEYFYDRADYTINPELPSLNAWIVENPYD